MEGGEHSVKQKSNRLESIGAKLSIRAQAQAMSNGAPLGSGRVAGTTICLECGNTAIGSELCNICIIRSRTQIQAGAGLNCPVCHQLVYESNARCCAQCKQKVHQKCDSSEPSIAGFVCIPCRKSAIVNDVMLGTHAAGPLSPHLLDAPSSGIILDPTAGPSSTLNPFSEPQLQGVPDFPDMYNLAGDISSPATCSDQNSPSFYPENSPSDVDEDFVPGSTRGRGGGKKKPGRGSMKTRSGGKPPTGAFLDKVGQSTRGKRGKRGSNKNGKGPSNTGTRGRGRGRPSPSMSQQPVTTHAQLQMQMLMGMVQNPQLYQQLPQQPQPQPVQIVPNLNVLREVDESMLEEHDRTDRSDDPEYVRTVVICDANDVYMQHAPLCLVCGSVGKGSDGTMVSCSNCAQTYHTYCVGLHDKISPAIVSKGWRCLDCTVCEGCGEGKDESKLLLCEECDVSYHIYCLSPPLDKIPNGPWRCQMCARCRRCAVRVSSGIDLTKEGLCTSCHSLRKCPKCCKLYQLGDKIIRCSACLRWYHGTCEDLYNDEMLENASQNKMRCSACRPSARNFGQMMAFGEHQNLVVCDNVALNKSADEVLQSKFMPSLFRQDSFGPLGYSRDSIDHYGSIDDDYIVGEEYEMITTGGRGRGRGMGPGRKVPKLGVGGFFVKIPRHRVLAIDDDVDDDGNKKQKRPRKPRRSQLEDAYPPAIQEGFFGMKPIEGKNLLDQRVDEPTLHGEVVNGQKVVATQGHELSHEATEFLRNDLNEADVLDNIDINMNMDDLENMDFDNWLDGSDDDDDFNDVMDYIKNESFDSTTDQKPTISQLGAVQPQQQQQQHHHHHHHHHQQQQQHEQKPIISTQQIDVKPCITPYQQQQQQQHQQQLAAAQVQRSGSQMTERDERVPAERTEIARWEEDEPLGLQATKAAVLYANVKYPNLKEQFPEWSERVKQIQRFWRCLDSDSRQEFVNKARENRANRGKVPRVRKIKVQSTSSVDSPTIQSPAPRFFQQGAGGGGGPGMPGMMDDRFKVPTTPLAMQPGPSSQHMRPDFYHQQQQQQPPQMQQMPMEPQTRTVRVVNHLNQSEMEQYHLLNKRSEDLRKHQDVLEIELSKFRKQKKNLTAKKRQMAKSAGNDPSGQPIVVDLQGQDKENLDNLPNLISLKSKDLEVVKREIKSHQANIQEFELKHNILQTIPTGADPAEIMRMQMANRPSMAGSVGQMPHPGPPPGSVFPVQQHPQLHPQFQQMRVPQQVPYGMMQAPISMQMRPPQRMMRTPVMGGRVYDRLQTREEKEVYEVLDDMVGRIHMSIEGVPEMRMPQEDSGQSGMLKRLLEPSSSHSLAALHPTPGGLAAGAPHMMDLDPPRPKKKRTQPKKPGMTGNEYELMIERVETQLRLIDKLPQAALEPAPRNPGAAFASLGISDLPDRPHKKATSGYELGHMSLTFVEDFFKGEERGPQGAVSHIPSMVDMVCPPPQMSACQAVVAMLKRSHLPEEPEIIADKEDAHYGLFDPMAAISRLTGRYQPRSHLRVGARVLEVPQPLEPHRSVFHMDREPEEEVDVSIVIKTTQNADMNSVLNHFKEILELDASHSLEFQMDTPPQSPEPELKDDLPCASRNLLPSSSAPGGKCRACETHMNAASIRSTMSQLGLTPSDDDKDDSVSFCSMKCYYQFVAASKVALSPDQLASAEQHVDEETMTTLKQISAESFAKCMTQGKVIPSLPSLPSSDSLLTSPRDTRYVIDEGRKDNIQIIRVADLAALQEVSARREVNTGPSEDWKTFNKQILESYIRVQQFKNELLQMPKMGVMPRELDPSVLVKNIVDSRICVFCGGRGDGEPSISGRMLNLEANTWVHVNCALWSAEVYENSQGGLVHVDRAVCRALSQLCNLCGRHGASLQCHKADCSLHFHLPCARKIQQVKFIKDKTFFCARHVDVINPDVLVQQLDCPRRIFIERDENKLLSMLFEPDTSRCMKLGALTFYRVGQLLPDQLKAFHNSKFIFPSGYHVSRWFWNPSDPRTRIHYTCTIGEMNQRPLFTVSYLDMSFTGETATDAWRQILNAVKLSRQKTDFLSFFEQPDQGEILFGLTESAVSKITESLPGVDSLFTYNFRHPNSNGPLLELPLAVNPSGCARAEPRFRTLIKNRNRITPSSGARAAAAASSNETATGRSRSTKSSFNELVEAQLRLQSNGGLGMGPEWALLLGGKYDTMNNSNTYSLYQKMKKDVSNTVYLARSKIQGLGLYAKRDINMGDMIVEYKGEIIRNEVCNVREKKYVAQNRGVYMFRIDEEISVDATMAGGLARYINHSCDPNCSTKVIQAGPALEDKKIVITANRPIKAREELTYDYQFELEDEDTKVPCLCGAPNCVKWMN